jgi:hypothetical protein
MPAEIIAGYIRTIPWYSAGPLHGGAGPDREGGVMKKKLVLAGLSVLMGALVIAWGWGSVKENEPKKEEPRTVFYFGLPEKPVYSKSVVDSP